jgi:hypothetical protein
MGNVLDITNVNVKKNGLEENVANQMMVRESNATESQNAVLEFVADMESV